MWHNRYHSFPFVLVPVWESLSMLWHETYTKGLRVRFATRPEVDEGRKVGEKTERFCWQKKAEENSRLEIAVQRRTQSTEGGSEQTEAGQRSESTEVRKTTAKTCWPTEAGLTNARRQSTDESALLVALWKFRAKYSTAIACKCTESCTKVSYRLPRSCAWSWPKSVFVLFLHPLRCVLSICKEMCNAPGRRLEKPLDDLIERSWYSGGRPAGEGCCHNY